MAEQENYLSKFEEKFDEFLNFLFDIINRIDQLPEFKIYYEPKGAEEGDFVGASDITGKIKINTRNIGSLEKLVTQASVNVGEIGYKSVGLSRYDLSENINEGKKKVNSIEESYNEIRNTLEGIADALLRGNENADYQGLLYKIQAEAFKYEGKFYWEIPVRTIINYAEKLDAVLNDAIYKYGVDNSQLKEVYEDFNYGLKRFSPLRLYAKIHPNAKAVVNLDTAQKVLKYEARKKKEEEKE